jgi:hypothetical protein
MLGRERLAEASAQAKSRAIAAIVYRPVGVRAVYRAVAVENILGDRQP